MKPLTSGTNGGWRFRLQIHTKPEPGKALSKIPRRRGGCLQVSTLPTPYPPPACPPGTLWGQHRRPDAARHMPTAGTCFCEITKKSSQRLLQPNTNKTTTVPKLKVVTARHRGPRGTPSCGPRPC